MTGFLALVQGQLTELGLPYEFGQWTGEVTDPYFVGTVTGQTFRPEDRHIGGTFTLEGWSRQGNLCLLEWADRLRAAFEDFQTVQEGRLYALRFLQVQSIPTGTEGLFRVQVRIGFDWWG